MTYSGRLAVRAGVPGNARCRVDVFHGVVVLSHAVDVGVSQCSTAEMLAHSAAAAQPAPRSKPGWDSVLDRVWSRAEDGTWCRDLECAVEAISRHARCIA